LVARAERELGDDLVQVVFDGTQALEQLGSDLWVGQAVTPSQWALGIEAGVRAFAQRG
jgi:hypothetical protein